MTSTDLKQKLAAIEHERWSDWQRYCHGVLRDSLPDHYLTALNSVLERWDRQIATPYDQLSEPEKASDMEQVDRYWPLIEAHMAAVISEVIGEDIPNPPLEYFWNIGRNQLRAEQRQRAEEYCK